jgi:hypothetical protein
MSDQRSGKNGGLEAKGAGLGDDQGTRVGAPDQAEGRMRPGRRHADAPPSRPELQMGAGGEATEGTPKTSEGHDREHRSGYGGSGGKPVTSSDERE